jgi:hypothetical protein
MAKQLEVQTTNVSVVIAKIAGIPARGLFLVMWNLLDDLVMAPVTPCLVGTVLPLGVLAAVVSGGLRKKSPRRWRVALVLGVLSCLLYGFPAVAAVTV